MAEVAPKSAAKKPGFVTRVRLFASETVGELQKAAWPSWLELRETTGIVLMAIALAGVCVALYDFSVYSWVQLLTRLIQM